MTEPIAYRINEAAKAIGISRRSIERRIQAGEIRAKRLNGATVIEAEALRAYIASCPDIEPRKPAQS